MTCRQRIYQKRNVANGKCMLCGKPLVSAVHCEYHRQMHADKARRRAQAMKAAGKCQRAKCRRKLAGGSRFCAKHLAERRSNYVAAKSRAMGEQP